MGVLARGLSTIYNANAIVPKMAFIMYKQIMNLKFISLLLFSFCLFLFAPSAFAQFATSDCVSTEVGSPTEDKPENPENCQSSAVATGDKPGGIPAPELGPNAEQEIYNQFGVRMTGFDRKHMEWAWKKFWDVSNTRFSGPGRREGLINGAVIVADTRNVSEQVGCYGGTSIRLMNFQNESGFRHNIVHELGHFIRNCVKNWDTQYAAHMNAFAPPTQGGEGPISFYGTYADVCYKGKNDSEDYADMVTYYLNPESGISSINKCKYKPSLESLIDETPDNPFFVLNPPKVLHLEVARKIFAL